MIQVVMHCLTHHRFQSFQLIFLCLDFGCVVCNLSRVVLQREFRIDILVALRAFGRAMAVIESSRELDLGANFQSAKRVGIGKQHTASTAGTTEPQASQSATLA